MKILLHGAAGRMGQVARSVLEQGYGGAQLVAAVDMNAAEGSGVYRQLREYTGEADCLIDFSHHSATGAVYQYVVSRGLPCVIATTGQTQEELELLHQAARTVPVFISANMSMGIAMLAQFAKQAAALMPEADIEIVEVHHNRKVDAPSGTALLLADAIRQVRPEAELVCGREGQGKRRKEEIGIHSLRMGNIVGVHEVHIGTDSQSIVLRHEAHDRALFAEGAVKAAAFLMGKPAGLYTMEDLFRK